MGKRYALTGLFSIILLLTSLCVGAAEPSVTFVRQVDPAGFDELMVTTPLGNYLFSEDGGTLKSALLTFAPYGSTVSELVIGTRSDDDTFVRTYYGTEFAFDLQYEGIVFDYALAEPVTTDTGALIIEMRGEGGGITIVKRFTIEPDALYTMIAEVEITSSEAWTDPLHLLLSNYTPQEKGKQLTYLYDGEPEPAPFESSPLVLFQGLGLMDDETVFFLKPDGATSLVPFAELSGAGTRRVGISLPVSSGSSSYRFVLYGGRRRYISMEAAGIEALDETGIFARLMVYVIRFLNWLYRYTGNYGWAIILFTILMRILLFPLMRKQYHSMARIQQIQPRLKRIQAKYKDNKEEMQKQTLEIYRKEKVNPMSGCFPMLVQLPIIIVIWRALLYASEQIHLSPGFLWVSDLSLHDPYFILVVLTTLIMLVQQYFMAPMTATDASGPQKYMGYFFPILMAFLLWKFPAGLWLYYLLTTAAQVAQQAFVNWEMARIKANQPAVAGDDFIDVDGSTTESDNGDAA
ncbi:MAG: YidC/Oxa1 family membrane protein insertase [Candidatus Atribacteria bacterium]|nr:MAG: YidC/Oxa1 family membrane protein insertase [Candidatus Atribacteria bacterium]